MSEDAAQDAFRKALEQDAHVDLAAGAPPPPPRRDPEAPHGRDEAGAPLAPYGLKADGTGPRLKPAGPGRGGKAAQGAVDKPRVTVAPQGEAARAAASTRDYTEQLDDLAQGVWAVMSGVPVPWTNLRIRFQAQAAIWHGNTPTLVRSGNTIARHCPPVAAKVDALTTGNAAWMLPALFGLAPFVGQSLAMWRSPVAGDIERLAAVNEAAFQQMLDAATEQLAQEVQAEHERIREAANASAA